MPQFDNRKAAQVWQRVHAAPEASHQDAGRILALLPELSQCVAIHKDLAPSFRRQVSSLQGMCVLLIGESPTSVGRSPVGRRKPDTVEHRSPPYKNAPQQVSLRKCYGVQLRALSEYQALCGHPEFGPAFQALIPLAQETCLTILALLGS